MSNNCVNNKKRKIDLSVSKGLFSTKLMKTIEIFYNWPYFNQKLYHLHLSTISLNVFMFACYATYIFIRL